MRTAILARMYHGERFNGYTHLAGALLALGGAATLISMGTVKGDPWRVVSFAVYGSTLCLMYFASTLYHSSRGRAKDVFRKLDHVAIYLVIAGTYTPFALVSLDAEWGRTLLVAVWSLAALGVLQELWIARGMRLTSLAIYLVMGWLGLAVLDPLLHALTEQGMAWLAGGGIIYTLGVVFYLFDEKFPHWHGIWHLFVLAGSAAHYTVMVKFVA